MRGLHLGVRVSLGNTVPKYLLELFAGLASLASSLAMNAFIKHDVVEDWKLQYTPARYGVAQHFKILVLRGESMAGKSSFAKSLFGEQQTLLLNCQGLDSDLPSCGISIAAFIVALSSMKLCILKSSTTRPCFKRAKTSCGSAKAGVVGSLTPFGLTR